MRCPTENIDINGQKVTINTCDFDAKTMKRWDYPKPEKTSESNAAPEPNAPPKPNAY